MGSQVIDFGLSGEAGATKCQETEHRFASLQNCTTCDLSSGQRQSTSLAILRLIQAHDYARNTDRSLWEFAISLKEMRKDGVNASDLRWLLCQGYIKCANERTTKTSVQREFEPVNNLLFSKRAAFVITAAGLRCTETQTTYYMAWLTSF